MTDYRVQVANRETGKESAMTIQADSADDAESQATKMGFLVGKIERAGGAAGVSSVSSMTPAELHATIKAAILAALWRWFWTWALVALGLLMVWGAVVVVLRLVGGYVNN